MTRNALPVLIAAGLGTAPPLEGAEVGPILERMRDAAGTAALRANGTWLVSGTREANGVTGALSLRFDAEGRFLRSTGGELGGTEMFDGRKGVLTDWTGMPGPLELSTLAHTQLEIWIATGAWPVPISWTSSRRNTARRSRR